MLGFKNDVVLHIDYARYDCGGVLDVEAVMLNRQLQRTLHNHDGTYAGPLQLVQERQR